MSVYVLTHKKYNKFTDNTYHDILVGAYRGHVYGEFFDDEGDNISQKNANYCELTGIYWLWKHRPDDDYIGLVHYRRYFTHCWNGKNVLTDKEIRTLLQKADVILPFRNRINASVENQYARNSGFLKDLDRVEDILENKYPEYAKTWSKFRKSNEMYFFNMMIMRQELFQRYCSWLFDILFTLEPEIDLDQYNDYQKRIFGFLAERLLNLWVLQNHLRVKEIGVYNTEDDYSLRKRFLMAGKRVLSYGLPAEVKRVSG